MVGMGSWRNYILIRLYHISKIIPVPFIKNLPSDYDTIFTSLVEAAKQCKKQEQQIVLI